MYGIYNIYNNNNLLYVGKTNNFYTRLKTHMALQPWKNEITHIEVAECKNKIDMDIYEKYYINKMRPKYNKAIVYDEPTTFEIKDLNLTRFQLTEFINANKPKNAKSKNYLGYSEKRKGEIDDLLKKSIEINEGEKVDFLNSSDTLYHWYNSSKTEISFLQVKCDNSFFKGLLRKVKNGEYELIEGAYNFILKNRKDIFDNFQRYSASLEIDNYTIGEKRISKGFQGVNLISGANLETKNTVSLKFAEELKPFLIQLKNNFTSYKLKNVVKLDSSYSLR